MRDLRSDPCGDIWVCREHGARAERDLRDVGHHNSDIFLHREPEDWAE